MRLFEDRVEHRRKVAGRRVDDLQHLGSRGLLFQRLPLFGDQPRVLNRDHRLIGEGADEFDLPVGKRFHPKASEDDHASHLALAQQRHAEQGADPTQRNRLGHSVFRIGSQIGDMDDMAFKRGPPGHRRAVGGKRLALNERVERRCIGKGCHHSVSIALAGCHPGSLRIAQPCGGFEQCRQHRLQIERRAADDLQHVAGRRLVFQQFLKVARAGLQTRNTRVLHRDHRLLRKVLQQFDLLVGERPDFRAVEN